MSRSPKFTFGQTVHFIQTGLGVGPATVPLAMPQSMFDALVANHVPLNPSTPLFDIPTSIDVSTQNYSLSDIAASMNFSVRIQFQNSKLGFALVRGSQSKFIPLDNRL